MRQLAIELDAFPQQIGDKSLKKALEDSVIDAQENTIEWMHHEEMAKNQSYLLKTKHSLDTRVLVVNKKTLKAFTKQELQILKQAIANLSKLNFEEIEKIEAHALSDIEKELTIHEFSQQERQKFIKQIAGLYFRNRELIKKYDLPFGEQIQEIVDNAKAIPINLSNSYVARDSAISIKRGVRMAIETINSKGGIYDHPIVTFTLDHGGSPVRGEENLAKLQEDERVLSVIGGMHSPVVLHELKKFKGLSLPYLIPWAAATPIIKKSKKPEWLFRFSIRDALAGPFLAEQALKRTKKIGLLLEDTPWGRGNHKSITEALANAGTTPLTVQWFNWGEKNFESQITKINELGSELIIFVGNAPEGINFVKKIVTLENSPQILSHWGILGGGFFSKTSEELLKIDLAFIQTFALPLNSQANPAGSVESFWTDYRNRYGLNKKTVIPAPFGTVHAYELTNMVFEAIAFKESYEREDIRDGLVALEEYQGIYQTYIKPFGNGLQEALDSTSLNLGKFDKEGNILKVQE